MTTAYRTRTVRLQERVSSDARLRVVEDPPCLRGVRVLGTRSGNGRTYEPAGLAAAAGLYEGISCFANHRQNNREQCRVEDKLGWLSGIHQAADGSLVGDLNLLASHPMTPRILEAARRRPELFALSHDAIGAERAGSRGTIIEAVREVFSVDVVSQGATATSLWESRGWPQRAPAPRPGERDCERTYRRARELAAARQAAEALSPEEEAEARRRLVLRIRNAHLGPNYDPEAAEASRARLVERLRRVRSPGGGAHLTLQEQLDAEASRADLIRRIKAAR